MSDTDIIEAQQRAKDFNKDIYIDALAENDEKWTTICKKLGDKVDGLESELDDVISVCFKRGAVDYVRLNYPDKFKLLGAALRALGDKE